MSRARRRRREDFPLIARSDDARGNMLERRVSSRKGIEGRDARTRPRLVGAMILGEGFFLEMGWNRMKRGSI